MTDTKSAGLAAYSLPDPARFAQNLAKLSEQAARLAQTLSQDKDTAEAEAESQILPMAQVQETLGQVWQAHMAVPEKFMAAQAELWAKYGEVWSTSWAKAMGMPTEPVAAPSKNDKRFKDKEWSEHSLFDFFKQIYLVTSQWAMAMVDKADGIDPHTKQKARFYVENILNALSPSNSALLNPEVVRATLSSNGENLLKGLEKLNTDMSKGHGRLRITQVDGSAFKLGENIATTPGKVVFRNNVFELIQYSPQVPRNFEIPLLIVPPWINKFYILDLTPQKSFIKWCVENGLTVFIMSWVNADEDQGRLSFSDYMRDGFLTAIDAVQKATGASKVNTVGFCIGGSLVAASLGYMAAKGDSRVNAATFFTTQVDFESAGDLLVYVDEEQVKWIEQRMQEKGYLPGARMADAFNLLRSNDLIWSYVVNNYLLGKDPAPFDLLYWNSDSTRMPAGVHSFYLRECYLDNKLSTGRMVLDNVRIDLKKVKLPVYNLAAKEDHIAPLPSVFKLGKYFGGETTLVVSGSGHIAGVVNPPAANKYQHWTDGQSATSPADWLKTAKEHPGSWWPHWLEWVTAKSGDKIPAPVPGEGGLPPLGDAPGTYVRMNGVN
jgi:polyhydroxyalkanoate synthase subunit PhaC